MAKVKKWLHKHVYPGYDVGKLKKLKAEERKFTQAGKKEEKAVDAALAKFNKTGNPKFKRAAAKHYVKGMENYTKAYKANVKQFGVLKGD